MAIATQSVSATAIARSGSTASTSYTVVSGLTISAGSGLRLRLMACISRSEISKYSDLPTWNGVALSMIGTPTTGGSGEYCVHWELIAPTPGTGNLVITNNANTNDGTFWYIVETGTNGSPATGFPLENASATSAAPSATVPAGASAIVSGSSFAYATATPGVLAGTTQIGTNESHRYCGQAIGAAPGVGSWASANQVAAFTSVVGAAATNPVITGPSGNATGNTTATVGFTTDQAISGGLPAYFLTLPAATAAPANEAALIADGATVSQTTGGTTPTRALTGLTAGTAYRTHMCQPGSNVVSSASYTPSALSAAGSIATQGGVQGDTFAWTGALPNTFFSGGIGAKTIACTGLGASGLTVVNTTTGVLGGTQGTPGTYNLTFTQTDSSTAGTNPNGGGSPPQTATRTATLVITATGSAPTVNTNPTNLTVADGATASFTGSFDGSPIPSLQWQEFIGGVWTAMSGEVANVLALGVVDMLDTGRIFRIAGTNVNGGPIYSSSATLTVTGTAVGTITSDVFADWADDTPLASLNIEFVVLIDVATGASVLELTNQVTDTAGILTITDAALTAGDDYMLAVFNADGSVCGIKAYTAT